MGGFQRLKNYDAFFDEVKDKIVINDLSFYDKLDKDILIKSIYKEHEDNIETIPSCPCGHMQAGYLLGVKCPVCGGLVSNPLEITHKLWARAIDNGPTFINPDYLNLLNTYCGNIVPTLLGAPVKSKAQKEKADKVIKMVMGGQTGYIAFINNIGNLLKYFISLPAYLKPKVNDNVELNILLRLWETRKDLILCRHIPVTHSGFSVVKSSKGSYCDLEVANIVSAARGWSAFCSSPNKNKKRMEKYYTNLHLSLLAMGTHTRSYILAKKQGAFRKNLCGTRQSYSSRSVIVAFQGKYEHDEMHLPWVIAHGSFQHHLINLLVNRHGYSTREADEFLNWSIKNFNPLTNSLLQTLVKESDGGIRGILHRNPTLLPSSMLFLRVTKFKTNPKDKTITFPQLKVAGPNADFDGDALTHFAALDKFIASKLERFSPKYTLGAINNYGEVNSILSLLEPANSLLTNFTLYGAR